MYEEIHGIYPASVCDIKDPEKRGRIKVVCPDIFGDVETSSAWCDPCVPYGFEDSGDICVPAIDEGVWIMFNDGDIDRPVYLGGWWSDSRTPFKDEYPSDPSEKRIISFKDNKITMKDGETKIKAGEVTITLKDGKITVKGDIDITGDTTITGDLSVSKNLTVTKDISAKDITASGDISGKNITASTKLTASGTFEVDSFSATGSISAGSITSSTSVSAGSISATSASFSSDATIGGKSFTCHKHKVSISGTDYDTSTPN